MIFKHSGQAWLDSEDYFVKKFIQKFDEKLLQLSIGSRFGDFYEQVRIPEVSRVSDLIVDIEGTLVNVEFKLGDHKCLKNQATDHLKWCDYGYVCIPCNYYQHYPKSFYSDMEKLGIGIILGTESDFVEILKAYKNTFKKGKDREILKTVHEKLKLRKNKSDKEVHNQKGIPILDVRRTSNTKNINTSELL